MTSFWRLIIGCLPTGSGSSPVWDFLQLLSYRESLGPLVVRSLIKLELREKNERAAHDERKPMMHNFIVLGELVTSEVRSMP